MIDPILIVIMVIMAILLFYVSIYLLALYCHPEDAGFGTSCICKIIVVTQFLNSFINQIIGLATSWGQILFLSLDISNTRDKAGLNMDLAWMIIYIITFSLIIGIIPMAIFFYETDEDKPIVILYVIHTLVCQSLYNNL